MECKKIGAVAKELATAMADTRLNGLLRGLLEAMNKADENFAYQTMSQKSLRIGSIAKSQIVQIKLGCTTTRSGWQDNQSSLPCARRMQWIRVSRWCNIKNSEGELLPLQAMSFSDGYADVTSTQYLNEILYERWLWWHAQAILIYSKNIKFWWKTYLGAVEGK